jgi:predicted dehydrogenase
MPKDVGFVTMGSAAESADVPMIGVGMLGYAFMGKAHSNGYRQMPYIFWPPPAIPRLVSISGRNAEAVSIAARRYGFEKATTAWQDIIADPDVDVFDNCGPNNLHAEPSIAAAEAGKHVMCEKPLGRTRHEAKQMLDAVTKAGVKHLAAFNYRFVPAILHARDIIQSGALGRIYHFRARYLQEWILDPDFPMVWRLQKDVAGSGVLGDLGAHSIDLARFLVGEIATVSAATRTFIPQRTDAEGSRQTVDVDDAFAAVLEFENGALGTLEASRFALGRKNHNTFEINGEKGSIVFNLERLNELEVHIPGQQPENSTGFTTVLVSEASHPYWKYWWPQGHMIGWENLFVHEVAHFLGAVVGQHEVAPIGATFEDGYRAAVVCDAILESARTGMRIPIAQMMV